MNFKKLTFFLLLLSGLVMSPFALAQSSFDGENVKVKFEVWEWESKQIQESDATEIVAVLDENGLPIMIRLRNDEQVIASDTDNPDIERFYTSDKNFHLWDIDFHKRAIELIFRSIEIQDYDNQYMSMYPMGFHIEDIDDNFSDILNVSVDDRFSPAMFNKNLVSFDANNIYVSLQGSMCRTRATDGMPKCANPKSPTGYNSIIKLDVLFAGTVDALFDWAEKDNSNLFPGHEESFYLFGHYVREYPDFILGTIGGNVLLYDKATGDTIDVGLIGLWLLTAGIECPEGQHSMGDDECMDDMLM